MAVQVAGGGDTWAQRAFGFVQVLAAELSEGRVHLPGIPEVALRIQRVLNDERAMLDQIVQALNAEPTLAMQVMRLANSAAYGAGLERAQDVRAAVQRVGLDAVRAAAVSFLVAQLRGSEGLRALRSQLNGLWHQAVAVGVTGKALAARSQCVVPDAALLAGLLHVVGRMYILTRMHTVPALMEQQEMVQRISSKWSGNIGKALLENWEMPEEYGEAVAGYDNPDRPSKGTANLTDVLAAASLLAGLLPEASPAQEDGARAAALYGNSPETFRRLRLSEADCCDALHDARRELQQLRALFGA